MNTTHPALRRLLPPLAAAAMLSACGAGGIDVAGLSGAASMQIEVEVYKGPLSKELDVQKSELVAKLYESAVVVDELVGQTRTAMCALACFDRRSGQKSHKLYPVTRSGSQNDFAPYIKPQFLAPGKEVFRHKDAKTYCASRIHDIKIEKSTDKQKDVCPILDTMEFDLRAIKGRGHLFGLYQTEEVFTGSNATPDPNIYSTCDRIGDGQYTCIRNDSLISKVTDLNDPKKAQVSQEFLLNAANYAEFLHSRAAFFATQQTALAPKSKRARRAIANFTQFLAEYGNQISARADAILKQEALFKYDDPTGNQARKTLLARELLANTAYLRDSAPTGYLNLYKFNDASAATTRRGATNRIRLVEQLTADTYWTRINSVFAAGQGDATFAFIKDDIGNWDLKKFDNRPGDLVDAYKSAGLAALQEVASLASGGASKIGDASKLLSFAERINFGGGAASNARIDTQVDQLRQRTKQRLEFLQTNEQARYDALAKAIAAADTKINETKTEIQGLNDDADQAKVGFNSAAGESARKKNEIAALEGQKQGLQDALATAGEDQRPGLEGRIAALDNQIAIKRAESQAAEANVLLESSKNDNAQRALRDGNDKLKQQEAERAALKTRLDALPAETARLARQILDNYLATLEAVAGAAADAEPGGAAPAGTGATPAAAATSGAASSLRPAVESAPLPPPNG